MNVFTNAEEAFEFYYDTIKENGVRHANATAIFNEGFVLENPMDNLIKTPWRKWQPQYAMDEWEWYMLADNDIKVFEDVRGKRPVPQVWYNHANEDGFVMSNYGWQWARGKQIDYVLNELKRDPQSRRALLTMYDGKDNRLYTHDTPCTLNAHFQIVDDKLNMTIMMRSNDLIMGFCNDQYCFSMLQQLIADKLDLPVGEYFHFASNLHIYDNHLNMKNDNK